MQGKALTVRWKVEKPTAGDRAFTPPVWTEVLDPQGSPRGAYEGLLGRLQALPASELRGLDERLEATMRELGVSFDLARDRPFSQQKPWFCDLLPHVFLADEWQLIVRGVRQRLRAFEMFLHDLHGPREILRREAIPIAPVLGSPAFQKPAVGLRPPRDFYLHVGALCLKRNAAGRLEVSSHHFAQANGISCMVQNRRVLARVAPELFQEGAIASIADTPTAILETLREAATDLADLERDLDELPQPGSVGDPLIVLLSPGPGTPFYPEHGFLARRMGVPLVQGGDLLVLDDRVYLKTISGLERVHVIYNRVDDSVLDPLVLERGPGCGVPGLVHCLRQRTVALVNGLGAQLADDRTLLAFAPRIIRFYLGEKPLLPTLATYWLGDIDQREMVLNDLAAYRILPLLGDRLLGSRRGARPTPAEQVAVRQEVRRAPHLYVAQPINQGAETLCFERGRPVRRRQDHMLFALRRGLDFDVFPGALTRIAPEGSLFPAAGLGGGSKDTWVLPLHDTMPAVLSSRDGNGHSVAAAEAHADALASETRPRRRHELRPIPRRVTSRSAESLYWLGRYLERANHLAYIINTVETLETEELNAAERKLYKPMWNRLLPHLDASPRRSMSSPCDRYRLVLEPDEPGALVNVLRRALNNADSIQDTLSPEAWGALSGLRGTFARQPFFQTTPEAVCAKVTRKLSDLATRSIAQFYGLAESSMLDDDGWRFCVLGQQLERAIITSNAVLACFRAFVSEPALQHHPSVGQSNGNGNGNGNGKSPRTPTAHDLEIELSAFLRLLGTRDAYRRVYQIRAEPLPILQLLFQHPAAPRSVLRCLRKCAAVLRASGTGDPAAVTQRPLAAVEAMDERLLRSDWSRFFEAVAKPPTDALNAGEIAQAVLKNLRTKSAASAAGPTEEEPRNGLQRELSELLHGTMSLHDVIADCFLNHQAQLSSPPQPHLPGFPHGF